MAAIPTDKFPGGLATIWACWEFPSHVVIKLVITPETFWSCSDLCLNTARLLSRVGSTCTIIEDNFGQENQLFTLSFTNQYFELLPVTYPKNSDNQEDDSAC